MRRFALPFVALLAIITSSIVSPASAEIVLAQYDIFSDTGNWSAAEFLQTPLDGQTLYTINAQTFVATATGTVSSIQVDVTRTNTSSIPLSWTIRSTYAGFFGVTPDISAGGLLSSGTLANSDCPTALTGWTTVQMTPVELVAGQSYSVVATAIGTHGVYRWWTKYNNSGYSGGRVFSGWTGQGLGTGSSDFGFRVLGAVPEPSSIAALLSGIAGFVGFVRRRA